MATYSNSSLVNYTKISPNKNTTRIHSVYNPTGKITKITIHHMAGNLSVETCGNVFASASRQGSSNYGIGSDGRVGLYVDEKHRAWTSGSADNDYKAVTIEVANDGGASTNWHVSDKAYDKLIDLCVDICKRNNISKLNYTGDATGNLTRHNMFQATACPGQYLQSKFDDIARQVNQKLGCVTPQNTNVTLSIGDKVHLVSGAKYSDGKTIPSWLFKSVLYVRDIRNNGDVVISTLKTGAVTGVVASRYITKEGGSVVVEKAPDTDNIPSSSVSSASKELKIGNTVKLIAGAKYSTGGSVPSWVINSTLYVRDIQGDNIVVSTQKTGAITGVVSKKYIYEQKTSSPSNVATNAVSAFNLGDKVKLITGARYANGGSIPTWVFNSVLYVREIQGNNIVVSTLKTGAITGVVAKSNLKKI